ncbi:15274_t:CDS:1, partial [Dentiscutata heterogama]
MRNGIITWLEQEGFIEHYNDQKKLELAYSIIMASLNRMFLRRIENLEELLINDEFKFLNVPTFLNAMTGIMQLKTLHINLNSYKNSNNGIT